MKEHDNNIHRVTKITIDCGLYDLDARLFSALLSGKINEKVGGVINTIVIQFKEDCHFKTIDPDCNKSITTKQQPKGCLSDIRWCCMIRLR